MAGGISVGSDRNGRRTLDAALNLVPFIDLLSCCICFLMITAVWTQLSSMKVDGGASPCPECEARTPMPAPTLHVARDGYTLAWPLGGTIEIPTLDGTRLADVLAREHAARPDAHALELRADDGVSYERVVRAMDLAKGAGFPDVSLTGS